MSGITFQVFHAFHLFHLFQEKRMKHLKRIGMITGALDPAYFVHCKMEPNSVSRMMRRVSNSPQSFIVRIMKNLIR
ncbi:hypothetical protein EEL33_01865 [Muribaculaceae bacterium Isolate-037 (Harlan)]|nr:hypothetical protein EEL33_01865 [Muribaculaceae bacterium Isolate-037 (Harlan)]